MTVLKGLETGTLIYSCNKAGLNEEIFYFLIIFLKKVSVTKRVG